MNRELSVRCQKALASWVLGEITEDDCAYTLRRQGLGRRAVEDAMNDLRESRDDLLKPKSKEYAINIPKSAKRFNRLKGYAGVHGPTKYKAWLKMVSDVTNQSPKGFKIRDISK
jgi:hypothetical protein